MSLVNKQTMAELNERHLLHEGPTDTISFDYREARDEMDEMMDDEQESRCLGEIVVCPEVAMDVAGDHGNDVATETLLYVVHGMLHWCGMNDEDPADRQRMRSVERRVMKRLREEFQLSALFG